MATAPAAKSRQLTIGTVCGMLKDEFPDISISKIRYLEDQGLLAPRRTQGGYRLFSEEDVERLETILRLQRDEFLPLRVIRQELASPVAGERKRRRAAAILADEEDELDLDELSAPGVSSSSRITRSGRNSSRWRRRIVSSRSTSSSPKSR